MARKEKVKVMVASQAGASTLSRTVDVPPASDELTESEIALRAYSYWEARGCQGGSPDDDWYRAAEELRAELQK
jgi:Protein of unknown function (DUF2934)